MRDLAVLFSSLIHLNDLVEMRMKSLRNSSVFSLALVFLAESEHLSSGIIIEWKELTV